MAPGRPGTGTAFVTTVPRARPRQPPPAAGLMAAGSGDPGCGRGRRDSRAPGCGSGHRAPSRSSIFSAAQPAGTGSQKVSTRNSSTVLAAAAPRTPAAVSPAVSAASTAPRPPGVGKIEPIALPVRYTTAMVATGTAPPNAATHEARHAM